MKLLLNVPQANNIGANLVLTLILQGFWRFKSFFISPARAVTNSRFF